MGIYFNPGNESFTQARNSMVYVDKTGLIEYLNNRLSCRLKRRCDDNAFRWNLALEAGKKLQNPLQSATGYSDRILLVGINYDAEGKDKKHHTRVIEEWKFN